MNQVPGTFTPRSRFPRNRPDAVFMKDRTGGVVTPQHDVARHVDLLAGGAYRQPRVDSETDSRHQRKARYPGEAVMGFRGAFHGRLHHYITPQFSRTIVNFQRKNTDRRRPIRSLAASGYSLRWMRVLW